MGERAPPKNPWLAAGLTLLVTGLGQVYLRRWLRGLGWLGLVVLVGWLFVPGAAFQNPGSASVWELTPLLVVGVLSVADAYLLARQHNVQAAVQRPDRCSTCYRELDAELPFCP